MADFALGYDLLTYSVYRCYEATIPGFLSGQTYYVRAPLGNLKGYGSFCSADSTPVVPSTWRALDQSLPRLQNQSEITARILEKVVKSDGHISKFISHESG